MSETLRSVGIDIGTSTTQLVFSRLHLRNEGAAFSVPHYAIAEKEILYRSKIHFTPLLSDTRIDAQGVRDIVDAEYAAAGVEKQEVQTGAVIITGETARKENAREVLDALSGYAGDFVVATAGPALESVLAGKGAGAQEASKRLHQPVLNLDIGGGTTNLALFEDGELMDTGCLNVGGRLMKFDPSGNLTYLSPVLQPFFDFPLGARPVDLQAVVSLLTEILEEAAGLKKIADAKRFSHFVTDKRLLLRCQPRFSLSGGVAALLGQPPEHDLAYGDLGVLLARAISRTALCGERHLPAAETIRATVIGAGIHATTLSGSTIFYSGVDFPLKNLPVATLSARDEALEPEALTQQIRKKAAVVAPQGESFALWLQGRKSLKFSELCRLADGLAPGFISQAQAGKPLVIAAEADIGKALGQAVGQLLPGARLVCLDGVRLSDGAYLDIGAPVAGGQTLPVVIKTLIL